MVWIQVWAASDAARRYPVPPCGKPKALPLCWRRWHGARPAGELSKASVRLHT